MSPRTRLRSAMARALRRSTEATDRWSRYLAGVEPALAATPRVHRYAKPPVIGESTLRPEPIGVWIDGDGDPADRTRASFEHGTAAPAIVLEGPLEHALQSNRLKFIALVRAGDTAAPLAAERLGQAAALAPDAAVITCDDDATDAAGQRHSPRFRPGPSPDHWLACDDSGALLVVARERAAAVLPALGRGPAWRHELALALAGQDGLGHAHVPTILCHRGQDVADAPVLEPGAILRLLGASTGALHVAWAGSARRIDRRQPHEPAIEVIVCLRDRPELLKRCADSLLTRTSYDRLALAIVDNGSTDPETLALLVTLARDARVRILRDDRPFNFAALNNLAARSSKADVLVFLNNDTEINDSDWLVTLLGEALRPEVGAVAPLLLYPDGSVQHAGAALGLHGYAGHPFAGLSPNAQTPFGSAAGGTRNWLAVTAACMMVERAKFVEVGGFDESFVVAGNDVDLCLRLTARGYRSLCVPHAVVLHDESRSRGAHIDPADFVRSEQSYGAFRTLGDPFYNPNLTLRSTTCEVRVPGEEVA